jgi:transcriptional regulator with XRE-family HTH domain
MPTTQSLKASDDALSVRLSNNIATRRRALDLTQAQLAERLGIDTETLSRFERGKHVPSLKTLERMAEQLRTTIGDLLEENPSHVDEEAQAVSAWFAALKPDDKKFVQKLLKQICDHLATK